MCSARPICFRLDWQLAWRDFSRAWAKTGKRMAARMAMIAMTTSSSISVNPPRFTLIPPAPLHRRGRRPTRRTPGKLGDYPEVSAGGDLFLLEDPVGLDWRAAAAARLDSPFVRAQGLDRLHTNGG